MGPFFVVVPEIFRNLLLPQCETSGDAFDALILDRAVESLEVGIVVRGPDPAVPVREPLRHDLLREPF